MQSQKKVRATLVEEFYRCMCSYQDADEFKTESARVTRKAVVIDRFNLLSRICSNQVLFFPVTLDPRKNEDKFYKYLEDKFGLTREDANTPTGPQY